MQHIGNALKCFFFGTFYKLKWLTNDIYRHKIMNTYWTKSNLNDANDTKTIDTIMGTTENTKSVIQSPKMLKFNFDMHSVYVCMCKTKWTKREILATNNDRVWNISMNKGCDGCRYKESFQRTLITISQTLQSKWMDKDIHIIGRIGGLRSRG